MGGIIRARLMAAVQMHRRFRVYRDGAGCCMSNVGKCEAISSKT
jgi:hypothetical protein